MLIVVFAKAETTTFRARNFCNMILISWSPDPLFDPAIPNLFPYTPLFNLKVGGSDPPIGSVW